MSQACLVHFFYLLIVVQSGSFDSGSASAMRPYIRSSDNRSWKVGATVRDCEGGGDGDDEGGDGPAGSVGEEEEEGV